MTGRRQFLGGLFATGLIPAPTWADAGSPAFLSAAAKTDGGFVLCGISADLKIRFELPLPARGHAAAAHPIRPEAVAFARRPGTFAVVIDCITGEQTATLTCPEGRHFYGHGAFSANGALLFTTENDYEAGQGRIGVWDSRNGYKRIDEFASGGIGPHDIKRLPNTHTLVVANGGIDTHPESGRTKLNIPTMKANLSYIEHDKIVETASLPSEIHKNSIRHLSVKQDGEVAFGMQWQGDGPVSALVGTHSRGAEISLMKATPDQVRQMNGYIGSIAYSTDGKAIAVTSPRGGMLQIYDAKSQNISNDAAIPDVCGVIIMGDRFIVSSGNGDIAKFGLKPEAVVSRPDLSWDNHLVSV
jgi:hypothetical protein